MKLSGVVTALVTPFDLGGQINEYALRELIDCQVESGVRGLCPLGGTGEPLTLTREEQRRVAEITIDQARRRVPVIVGVLLVSPKDIIDRVAHAAELGASAVMFIPPYFLRLPPEHVYRHFVDIGRQSPLPFLVFNVPSRSGVHFPVDLMKRLQDSTENFVGVKESTTDITELQRLRRALGPDAVILQGSDSLFAASLAVGADGGILALGNLCPDHFVSLYEAWRQRDVAEANRIQSDLLQLIKLVYAEAHPAPLKKAMEMAGRPIGATRRPLYEPKPDLLAKIKTELQVLGLIESERVRA
jgi:4-hydroxy-tetrahydrodipicolinate synthase